MKGCVKMKWELVNDRPIYAQLLEQVERAIVAGFLLPGEKLPGVRDMAAEAGVNPNTMQRAMAELERRGLLYSQRTSGRYVTEDIHMIETVKSEIAREVVKNFYRQMEALGYSKEEARNIIEKMEG